MKYLLGLFPLLLAVSAIGEERKEVYKTTLPSGEVLLVGSPESRVSTLPGDHTITITYNIERISKDSLHRKIIGGITDFDNPDFLEGVSAPPYPNYFGILDMTGGEHWVAVVYWRRRNVLADVFDADIEKPHWAVDIHQTLLCSDFDGRISAKLQGDPSTGLEIITKKDGEPAVTYRFVRNGKTFGWHPETQPSSK